MRNPEFRAHVEGDPALMWKCFNRLDFAMELVEIEHVCCGCNKRYYRVKGAWFRENCFAMYRSCSSSLLNCMQVRSFWAKREMNRDIQLPDGSMIMAGQLRTN